MQERSRTKWAALNYGVVQWVSSYQNGQQASYNFELIQRHTSKSKRF